MKDSDPLAAMALQVASALFPSEVRTPGQDCGADKGQPPGAPCPVCVEQAAQWAARVAEVRAALYAAKAKPRAAVAKELAETRAALAEVLADMVTQPEPGNPWRLHSIRRASELLTGEPLGFSGAEVFRGRLARGTLGGRFRAPFLGAELEPLGRAVVRMREAESHARNGRAEYAAEAERARAEYAEELAKALAAGVLA